MMLTKAIIDLKSIAKMASHLCQKKKRLVKSNVKLLDMTTYKLVFYKQII